MFELISLLLFTSYNIEALIVEPRKVCAKSSTVTGPCHVCVCSEEGIFECNATVGCNNEPVVISERECEPEMIYKHGELECTCNVHEQWRSIKCRQTFRVMKLQTNPKNVDRSSLTIEHENLPEIKEGEICEPGKSYKMSCNTCRCRENKVLMCTKMACFDSNELKQIHEKLKRNPKSHTTPEETSNLGAKNIKKQTETKLKENILFNNETMNLKHYVHSLQDNAQLREGQRIEDIPRMSRLGNSKCIPGKSYRKDCENCYCTEKKKVVCIRTKCDQNKLSHVIENQEINKLRNEQPIPRLSHMGAECEPGKMYQVDCNTCWCSENRELYACTYNYCLDTDVYMDAESHRHSGKKCHENFIISCTECMCVNSITKCRPIPDCQPLEGRHLLTGSSEGIKLKLDSGKEKCIPNMKYKVHCNACHCMEDRSLVCTTKLCLTHSQVKSLEERFKYLQKNGL